MFRYPKQQRLKHGWLDTAVMFQYMCSAEEIVYLSTAQVHVSSSAEEQAAAMKHNFGVLPPMLHDVQLLYSPRTEIGKPLFT